MFAHSLLSLSCPFPPTLDITFSRAGLHHSFDVIRTPFSRSLRSQTSLSR